MSIRRIGEHHGEQIGADIYDLAAEIFPICRSITGDGVRATLASLQRQVPLSVREVPTGTQVFDWTIPREWNIRDAAIRTPEGNRIAEFGKSNLHILNYSVPVHKTMTLEELRHNIFTLPNQPDLIPYRTSYYSEEWGFCMSHNQFMELHDGLYEVFIDSDLIEGSLSYGEFLHQGESDDEVLLSAHICHPSLANDNCSGVALLALRANHPSAAKTHYSYRFVFAPGTIGAIAWLARNEDRAERIKHGLVVSCVGDAGGPTYKKSRRGDALIDRAMQHVLAHAAASPAILEFEPYGYDERQYCSPGFNLPVGLFQRSQFGTFPEYHTSADNLDLIKPEHLAESYRIITAAIDIIENDVRYINTSPKCEPQLGRRGLYGAIGGDKGDPQGRMAMLWVLNLSDGDHSLLDIAERAGIAFQTIADVAYQLVQADLLVPSPDQISGQ